MSAALVGLILLQYYWISNAVKVKEQQFDQLVNRALNETIEKLEAREAANRINYEISMFNNAFQNYILDSSYYDFSRPTSKSITYSEEFYFQQGDKSSYKTDVEIFTDDTLVYSNKSNLTDSMNHPRETMQFKMHNKARFVEDIINKMLFHDRSINEKVNKEMLNEALDASLNNKGIGLPYEFAVQTIDNVNIFKTNDYHPKNNKEVYSSLLFPSDIFSTPHYLMVHFPEKRNHLKELKMLVVSSIILTLIIISIFSFTIYIIIHQKKLSQIKNDFVNNMTHELKTPISTISLAAQMLKDKSIPDEAKNLDRISKLIGDESKRLGFQVEKVLQMAIFDKGKIKLKPKKIDIHEIINTSLTNFNIQTQKRQGELTAKLDAKNAKIKADEVHVTNVIYNLLDNALKYSKEQPQIAIKTKNFDKGIKISIKDNGIGIAKENRSKIFEQFYRVPTGNIHNVKGFGMGLNYVKKIVDAHGGNIKLKSEINKGSEFIIYLPFDT